MIKQAVGHRKLPSSTTNWVVVREVSQYLDQHQQSGGFGHQWILGLIYSELIPSYQQWNQFNHHPSQSEYYYIGWCIAYLQRNLTSQELSTRYVAWEWQQLMDGKWHAAIDRYLEQNVWPGLIDRDRPIALPTFPSHRRKQIAPVKCPARPSGLGGRQCQNYARKGRKYCWNHRFYRNSQFTRQEKIPALMSAELDVQTTTHPVRFSLLEQLTD
jgi:hypothetical protein